MHYPEGCFPATLPWSSSLWSWSCCSPHVSQWCLGQGCGGRLEEGCACRGATGGPKVLHLDISGEVGPGSSCFSECDCDTIPVPRCHLVRRACPSPGLARFLSSLPTPSPGSSFHLGHRALVAGQYLSPKSSSLGTTPLFVERAWSCF